MIFSFFFFFQAEDGIRDLYVTGVQTCALPIWPGTCCCAPTATGSPILRDHCPTGARAPPPRELSVSDLTFQAPWRLLLLVAVAALAVAYVLIQRRRRAYAVRFTDVDLLASVAPKVPGWRRHLPAFFLVGALALMTGAFAKPAAAVQVPREAATIVVA